MYNVASVNICDGLNNFYGLTPISANELRYFCQGSRTIVQPIFDDSEKIIGITEITLDNSDLENIISYMENNNLPFSLQTFNQVQSLYISYKKGGGETLSFNSSTKSRARILQPKNVDS